MTNFFIILIAAQNFCMAHKAEYRWLKDYDRCVKEKYECLKEVPGYPELKCLK